MKKRKSTNLGATVSYARKDFEIARSYARLAIRRSKTNCADAYSSIIDMNENAGKGLAEIRRTEIQRMVDFKDVKLARQVRVWRRAAQKAFAERCVR